MVTWPRRHGIVGSDHASWVMRRTLDRCLVHEVALVLLAVYCGPTWMGMVFGGVLWLALSLRVRRVLMHDRELASRRRLFERAMQRQNELRGLNDRLDGRDREL